MKRIVILLVLTFLCTEFLSAQFTQNNAFYSTGAFNVGNYVGVDMSIHYVHDEKYSFKVGYLGNITIPRSQPVDYSSGLTGVLLFGLANPYDQLENYQIGMGKIFKLNKKGTIRVNASFGLGFTTIREPNNWERTPNSFVGENYTWSYHKYNTLSFIVNPKIEFPFTRFYGLTFSPVLEINKDRIHYGIGIGQMLGLLRRKYSEVPNH